MKQKRSIWMLFAGATVPKFLLILLGLAAVDGALFFHSMTKYGGFDLEQVLAHVPFAWVLFGAVLLWTLVVSMPGLSRMEYTLERLPLTRKEITHRHVLYSALSYGVLVSVQVLILMGLFLWYGRTDTEGVFGPQTILMTFYSGEFLHALFPLGDLPLILRNVILAAAMGMATAGVPLNLRKNKISSLWNIVLMVLLLAWIFPVGPEGGSVSRLFIGGPVFLLLGAGGLNVQQEKHRTEEEKSHAE